MFAITREEALARLDSFLPLAGGVYAKRRNYDYGPEAHDNVSRLSAALRRRTILEPEVIAKINSAHKFSQSEKFIQEVFWRTYWKGWLEMRPSVWTDYCQVVDNGFAQTKSLAAAYEGRTDIACFDAWSRELTQTNYLHNHARMWFASIWIHTLGLPWQAGAAHFMRYLRDGDAASNTLGWRWVAGLQTRGKAYAARADNIAQFTNERFAPYGDLQEDVAAIEGPENPPAMSLRAPRKAGGDKAFLLVTPEDCHPESLGGVRTPVAVSALPAALLADRDAAVIEADKRAMDDALRRAAHHYEIAHFDAVSVSDWQADLRALMVQTGADHIIMAFQPVGAWADVIAASDLPITEIMRDYDAHCWPHAKKGFFPFKEKNPSLYISLVTLGDKSL